MSKRRRMCKIREKQTVDFVTVSATAFAGVVLSTSLAGKRGNFGLMLMAFTKGKRKKFPWRKAKDAERQT